jgi:hypothetical protein
MKGPQQPKKLIRSTQHTQEGIKPTTGIKHNPTIQFSGNTSVQASVGFSGPHEPIKHKNPIVQLSQEQYNEYAHSTKLKSIHIAALHLLQEQAALFGPGHTPVHLLLEIDQRSSEIRRLEQSLSGFRGRVQPGTVESPHLQDETQQYILKTVADAIGLPADWISAIDIRLGSIRMTIQLPNDAAVRLIVLHERGVQLFPTEVGPIIVAFEGAVDTEKRSADDAFLQAVGQLRTVLRTSELDLNTRLASINKLPGPPDGTSTLRLIMNQEKAQNLAA